MTTQTTSPEQMARDVIADWLKHAYLWKGIGDQHPEAADAILALLAAHDPPLVIVTGDVMPPPLEKWIRRWLAANTQKPEDVRWGLFPLGFVAWAIEQIGGE